MKKLPSYLLHFSNFFLYTHLLSNTRKMKKAFKAYRIWQPRDNYNKERCLFRTFSASACTSATLLFIKIKFLIIFYMRINLIRICCPSTHSKLSLTAIKNILKLILLKMESTSMSAHFHWPTSFNLKLKPSESYCET